MAVWNSFKHALVFERPTIEIKRFHWLQDLLEGNFRSELDSPLMRNSHIGYNHWNEKIQQLWYKSFALNLCFSHAWQMPGRFDFISQYGFSSFQHPLKLCSVPIAYVSLSMTDCHIDKGHLNHVRQQLPMQGHTLFHGITVPLDWIVIVK